MTESIPKVSDKDSLPHGWTKGTIEDLVTLNGVFTDGDWVESKDQDPGGDIRLTQLADVGDGAFRDRSSRFLTSDKAQQLGCTFLQACDLLIARMPEPLGRACIFPGDRRKSVTVVDVCIVRAGTADIDHRWLMHFINSPAFRTEVAALQSGSTRKRISRKNLAKIELPVPPSREQRRIVEKIEELFTRLDAGIRSLKQTQALLESYRRSVLKAAAEGELSREWREAHRDELEPASELLERILQERREKYVGKKYKEPASPDTSKLPALPDGWAWATTDQLLRMLRNGISRKPDAADGLAILRISAVRPLSVDLTDVRYLSEELEAFADYLLKPGDLLFTRYNGNPQLVGVCGVVRAVQGNVVHPDKIIRGKVVSQASMPRFLEIALNVGESRQFLAQKVRTTAGQSGVSGGDIKAMPVPIPPFEEQRFIVEEVERRLSVLEKLEATLEENLKQADALRQSILKQAFSGELVPQDPDNEPASELLERIREERQAAKPKARKGGKSSTRPTKSNHAEQRGLF